MILSICIVVFYKYAIAQIISICFTQIIWLVYFNIILKPFINKYDLLVNICLENLLNVGLILVFIIFILDKKSSYSISSRNQLGY